MICMCLFLIYSISSLASRLFHSNNRDCNNRDIAILQTFSNVGKKKRSQQAEAQRNMTPGMSYAKYPWRRQPQPHSCHRGECRTIKRCSVISDSLMCRGWYWFLSFRTSAHQTAVASLQMDPISSHLQLKPGTIFPVSICLHKYNTGLSASPFIFTPLNLMNFSHLACAVLYLFSNVLLVFTVSRYLNSKT